MLSLNQVSYSYQNSGKKNILETIDMNFEKGIFYAIVGHSGEGKTTLLSLLAGLDEPTSGSVAFDGEDIKEKGYGYHRLHHISLDFQNYNLIDYMTPLENIRLVNKKADKNLLKMLGLQEEEIKRNILQLSGGQQQRVAIARALASDAPVILADEPTGNLDGKTTAEMIDILKKSAHQHGKCVIVVTHSTQVSKEADIVLNLKNRKLHMIKNKVL